MKNLIRHGPIANTICVVDKDEILFFKNKGVTLLEMLLVLVIIGTLLGMLVTYSSQQAAQAKRNKTIQQIQQILNAASTYYQNNGVWPTNTVTACSTPYDLVAPNDLQTNGYLPPNMQSPYVSNYQLSCNTTTGVFSVQAKVDTTQNSMIIAGSIPSATAGAGNTVTALAQLPGQNLNNARTMNFAGIYYAGSCVPAPVCPLGMIPKIYVAPTGVSGVNNYPTTAGSATPCTPTAANNYDPSTCSAEVFAVNSFSAFARGDINGAPTGPGTPPNGGYGAGGAGGPLDCEVTQTPPNNLGCDADVNGDALSATNTYWRVCLYVRTENGIVYPSTGVQSTDTAWGKMMGSVAVFTRCVSNNEPSGSSDVFQENVGDNP